LLHKEYSLNAFDTTKADGITHFVERRLLIKQNEAVAHVSNEHIEIPESLLSIPQMALDNPTVLKKASARLLYRRSIHSPISCTTYLAPG
jgi:hypothetical protein